MVQLKQANVEKEMTGKRTYMYKCGSLLSSGRYFSGEERVDGETEPRAARS